MHPRFLQPTRFLYPGGQTDADLPLTSIPIIGQTIVLPNTRQEYEVTSIEWEQHFTLTTNWRFLIYCKPVYDIDDDLS